ncbi:hypothetical protein BU26DRAFT_522714 [Trematosphaeria pertusa]|uniref:Putative gamma-glutamylcyclotransferase n=1 Tax=Trematosphaeria pertusa TaxID=390896 RepID=A0A6A6I3G1_9PLEO|nr:uncharacterized protein BU26DRAFT_522714 [Trematosphaeria pertusa]KAF2245024.1 hypothetical protein BU26DRAFT_522714 [Trematosphaeria pertusa]
MSPQGTTKMEKLEDWDCIDGTASPDPAILKEQEAKKPIEVSDSVSKWSKMSHSEKRSEKKKKYTESKAREDFRQQFSELELGPSGISITDGASCASSPDAETIIRELGYAGNASALPRSLRIAVNNRFTRAQLAKFKDDAELNFAHPLPYFFSGSFIFPACMRAVTNGTTLLSVAQSMTPALLRGYKRYPVKERPYPAMLPSTDLEDSVWGMLVFGMLDSQRRAIHKFENGMFDLRRTEAEIELQGGERVVIEVGVYVWNRSPESLVKLEERKWKIEDLMGSEWFNAIIKRAEEEERLLENHAA